MSTYSSSMPPRHHGRRQARPRRPSQRVNLGACLGRLVLEEVVELGVGGDLLPHRHEQRRLPQMPSPQHRLKHVCDRRAGREEQRHRRRLVRPTQQRRRQRRTRADEGTHCVAGHGAAGRRCGFGEGAQQGRLSIKVGAGVSGASPGGGAGAWCRRAPPVPQTRQRDRAGGWTPRESGAG